MTTGPAPDATTGRVLVVDDVALNCERLSETLTREGHTVTVAASAAEALRMLRSEAFDVVLLESDNGLHGVPVVLTSASDSSDPTLLLARVAACLEKKELYRRLQAAEKSRNDLRNLIVHDLRAPLTALVVGMEALDKSVLNTSQHALATLAGDGGRTLLGMIDDLLDVEKMESGTAKTKMGVVMARPLIDRAMQQVGSRAAKEHTSVATDIGSSVQAFAGDEKVLTRVVVNLLTNAVKLAPGGRVRISVRQSSDAVTFVVSDNGPGIPADAIDTVFQKFGDMHSGLGLAFCRLAVEAHGGQISADSKVGFGSTFSFTIPGGRAFKTQ